MPTLPYPATSLFRQFGRLVMSDEVPQLVPLIVLEGGPKHDWVYDGSRIDRREPDAEGAQYEYTGDVVVLAGGRLARVFRFVEPVPDEA